MHIPVYLYVHHVLVELVEVRRGWWIPWSGSYRWVWDTQTRVILTTELSFYLLSPSIWWQSKEPKQASPHPHPINCAPLVRRQKVQFWEGISKVKIQEEWKGSNFLWVFLTRASWLLETDGNKTYLLFSQCWTVLLLLGASGDGGSHVNVVKRCAFKF